MSCGVGGRRGLELGLLWLWCRLPAVALIGPLARELPYAAGAALGKKKEREREAWSFCCGAGPSLAGTAQ